MRPEADFKLYPNLPCPIPSQSRRLVKHSFLSHHHCPYPAQSIIIPPPPAAFHFFQLSRNFPCLQSIVHTSASEIFLKCNSGSSYCGAVETVASLGLGDTGSIPGPAEWVKDLVLPHLGCSLQLQLRSDP